MIPLRSISLCWRLAATLAVLFASLISFAYSKHLAVQPHPATQIASQPTATVLDSPPSATRLSNSRLADCGPRALALVCQSLGVSVSIERLRDLAGTTSAGTTLAGLAKAAKVVGLKAEGVQINQEALPNVKLPAVGWINRSHFVAVLNVLSRGKDGMVTIHDPDFTAEETISQDQLLRMGGGYLLLITK
ncbi:MAG TPA: cysteine peptidase family C39 domain-containing protein [Chthonomonadaceae bacterium]|nr:cysteine peptidase family C39 domain-containing protein [Chthonomonadaceae bacterium]